MESVYMFSSFELTNKEYDSVLFALRDYARTSKEVSKKIEEVWSMIPPSAKASSRTTKELLLEFIPIVLGENKVTSWLPFSVKSKVKVRLLQKGIELIERENFNHQYRNKGKAEETEVLYTIDSEGYVNMIFFDFMTKFSLNMLVWEDDYFDPNIMIEKEV